MSIQSDDPALGLPARLTPQVRRTAAEWIAAVAHAGASGAFSSVEICVDENFQDIGVSAQDTKDFLFGIVTILQASDIPVHLNLDRLRTQPETPLLQTLLVSCLQVQSLLETTNK